MQQGWQVTDLKQPLPENELIQIVGDHKALVVRSQTQITENILKAGNQLKYVGRAGTGVDNINLRAASNQGIFVMNTPGGNTISTAEHTMALLLSLCRNVSHGSMSLQRNEWKRQFFIGNELYGKTIGIIGLGKIGQQIAQWCKKFEMRVIGFDPLLSAQACKNLNIDPVSLQKLYQESDIITVHTPLNQRTKNLINSKTLKLCKPGIKLINCARGGIINEQDLLDALNSGQVSGAALDVYSQEPPQNHLMMELINHPNVVCTPHLGASTIEAQIRVAKNIAEQITQAEQGKDLVGVVNAPKGFEYTFDPQYRPYIDLTEKLGLFIASTINPQKKIENIKIVYYGNMLRNFSQVLTSGILTKGQDSVCLMNAAMVANEKGLQISEKFQGEHYITNNMIKVEITQRSNGNLVEHTIAGSCFARPHKKPYLVLFEDLETQFLLEGNILVTKSKDFPGAIDLSLQILAKNNINIENSSIGRLPGQIAICVYQLDSPLKGSVLKEIKNLKAMNEVYQINLNN